MNGYALSPLTYVDSAVPVVTTADMKLHLRVDDSDDDAVIAAKVLASTGLLQQTYGMQFINATYKMYLDGFPWATIAGNTSPPFPTNVRMGYPYPAFNGAFSGMLYGEIRLPRSPASSITTIKYYDVSGTQQTMSSTVYQTDFVSQPARVLPAYNQAWPATQWPRLNAVEITFVAGYGAAASSVSYQVIEAVKMLAAHWYENREATTEDMKQSPIWCGVEALMGSVRPWEFR